MSTTATGRQAEAYVSELLSKDGYKILASNWRNRFCEIDIVAQKGRVVYFYEVKFRSQLAQGQGLDYLTDTKLRQLKFAAEFWCSENGWSGDYRICAAAVSLRSDGLTIEDMLEIDF